MSCCGGGTDPAAFARQQEAERQLGIKQGTANINQAFSGFGPSFYDARKQAYLDVATPQLAQQTQDASQGLTFQLARQGLLHSGAQENQGRALERTALAGGRQIVDTANDQSNQLRTGVEQERSRLINQLTSTGDPNIAAQQAASSAANLRLPSTFAPVGQLFQTFANQYLLKNLSSIYNQPYGGASFAPSSGVSRGALPNPFRIQ